MDAGRFIEQADRTFGASCGEVGADSVLINSHKIFELETVK
jgi:hypothetical protein